MKARSTIVTALAVLAVAAPAAQANIPSDPGGSVTPRYHCLVNVQGHMLLVASRTKCPVHHGHLSARRP
jgi:hypothetical protein